MSIDRRVLLDANRTDCRCGRVTAGITNRREFLGRVGGGFALLALADLLGQDRLLADHAEPERPPGPGPTHHPARARSVIWLFMEGGPAAMDTFDPKPELARHHGRAPEMPIDVFFGSPGPLMRSPFKFARHGESGIGSATSCITSRGTSTTWPSSSHATPSRPPTARRCIR